MPRSPRSTLELLVASVATLVPALTAVTLALGTTAPVESCTVPTRRAVWVCAKHAAANKAVAKTIRTDPWLFIATSFQIFQTPVPVMVFWLTLPQPNPIKQGRCYKCGKVNQNTITGTG